MKAIKLGHKESFLLLFFLKSLGLYLLWFIIYEEWLYKVGWLDNFIIDNLVSLTYFFLNLFVYDLFTYEHVIGIDGSHGVYIGIPCNGIALMALFAGFIVIFKGSWKNKVWFIPLGILIIHTLNIARVMALTILAKYNPSLIEFNHKYTFTIILYFLVFIGWMFWVKFYSKDKTL